MLQLSYRLLFDSFGDHSNMFEVAWVQGLPQGWSVTPNVRYLAQHGADFYFNPPLPGRLRRRPELHGRHAARDVGRVHASA